MPLKKELELAIRSLYTYLKVYCIGPLSQFLGITDNIISLFPTDTIILAISVVVPVGVVLIVTIVVIVAVVYRYRRNRSVGKFHTLVC